MEPFFCSNSILRFQKKTYHFANKYGALGVIPVVVLDSALNPIKLSISAVEFLMAASLNLIKLPFEDDKKHILKKTVIFLSGFFLSASIACIHVLAIFHIAIAQMIVGIWNPKKVQPFISNISEIIIKPLSRGKPFTFFKTKSIDDTDLPSSDGFSSLPTKASLGDTSLLSWCIIPSSTSISCSL